ncbi:hypothetical protein [Amycolatopsis sp. NPDC051128]|uniref:hypothetical protein n=1 Tax=Amycolatopsis sp. NPDC051128 TaxID=3155412 RepID=UPI003434DB43
MADDVQAIRLDEFLPYLPTACGGCSSNPRLLAKWLMRARRIMGGGWRSWLFSRLAAVVADPAASPEGAA